MATRSPISGSQLVPAPRRLWDLVKDAVPPMHAAGRPFVAGALTFGVFGWRHGWSRTASLVAAGAVALAFRDPKRVPPTLAGAVVAPADGVVVEVGEAVPPEELGLGEASLVRVVVRTSLTDPYVLRAPVAGRVWVRAEDGSTLVIVREDGAEIGLVQTAATPVGRLTCDVAMGDELTLGQTYGLVRFGSLVEVYLPAGTLVAPGVGQRTVGAETLLGVVA